MTSSGFKALIGDLFKSRAATLVNTVNTSGVMGKGVALEFKRRWPAMFDDYKQRCDRNLVRLGEPYLYRDLSGASIINFPTKGHWKAAARLSDIERGLDELVSRIGEWKISSLAIPPLGCGNGGLEWADVGPLIYSKLAGLPIHVEVYAPFGTPAHQLTPGFLAGARQATLFDQGRSAARFAPASIAVMEVLRGLHQQPYTLPVGRSLFQKICHVVAALGVPLNLRDPVAATASFAKDADARALLREFANRNWLVETRAGQILSPSTQYDRDRGRFSSEIERHAQPIAKAVDLFSRIAGTDQAAQALQVMQVARQLRDAPATTPITQRAIRQLMGDRQSSLLSDPDGDALGNTIRSLAALGIIDVSVEDEVDLAA